MLYQTLGLFIYLFFCYIVIALKKRRVLALDKHRLLHKVFILILHWNKYISGLFIFLWCGSLYTQVIFIASETKKQKKTKQ